MAVDPTLLDPLALNRLPGYAGSYLPPPQVQAPTPVATPAPNPAVLTDPSQGTPTPPPTTTQPAPSSFNLPAMPDSTYERDRQQKLDDLQNQRAAVANQKIPVWRRLVAAGVAGLGTAAAMTGGREGQPDDEQMKQALNAGQQVLHGSQPRQLASLDEQIKGAQFGVDTAEKQHQQDLEGWKDALTLADTQENRHFNQQMEIDREKDLNLRRDQLQQDANRTFNKPTAESTKLGFQDTVSKVALEGLPTDPKSLAASISKSKTLSEQEKDDARGYMAANTNPATSLQVNVDTAGAKQDIQNANKWFTYTDENGDTQMAKGDSLPAGTSGQLPVKDPTALIQAANTGNIVQTSLSKLAKDVNSNPQIFDDPKIRGILATATEEGGAHNAGFLIAGTGGSLTLPAGVNKIIDTWLERNAINDPKTKDALQQYIADYWGMKDKLMSMQMQMQGGRIGRGSAQVFQAMMQMLPAGGTASSFMAQRQLDGLQAMHSDLMREFPEKYGNYTKLKPGTDAGSNVPNTDTPAGHSFTLNGKQYNGVPDALYNKYKTQPGFQEVTNASPGR
jgi:hypothetical protein